MMQEKAHLVSERVKAAGQWIVWRPLRLVGIIVAVLLIWIMIVQVTNPPKDTGGSTSTPTPTSGLPLGWKSWPAATGR